MAAQSSPKWERASFASMGVKPMLISSVSSCTPLKCLLVEGSYFSPMCAALFSFHFFVVIFVIHFLSYSLAFLETCIGVEECCN